MPAMTLEAILEQHRIGRIDLLSIDTEGNELDVCETMNWEAHRPRVVIIEYLTWGRPSQETAIRRYFARSPYRLIHRTTSNLIYTESRMRRLIPSHRHVRMHRGRPDAAPPHAEGRRG